MLQTIADALRDAWRNFEQDLTTFLPRILAMLTLVAAGWLAAWLTAYMTKHVLGWIRFNTLVERSGGGDVLRRSGLVAPDRVLASIVYWIVLIGFLPSDVQT